MRVDQLLALAGGLPYLGQVMPDVVGIEQSDDVTGPAADELWPVHDHIHHVTAAPVVPDQINRFHRWRSNSASSQSR